MIEFACTACGKVFKLKDEYGGKKAKCVCGANLSVPAVSADDFKQRAATAVAVPIAVRGPAASSVAPRDLHHNAKSSSRRLVWLSVSAALVALVVAAASPEIIYVPAYEPMLIYGPWWYPAYPPYYWYPPYYRRSPGIAL